MFTELVLLLICTLLSISVSDTCDATNDESAFMSVCVSRPKEQLCNVKKRRYDVRDMGWEKYFRGWADVQGQGGANDFCRMVGYEHLIQLSCALAGTHGQNDRGYNSSEKFMVGVHGTWYMKDEDNDGRDDYCRCVELEGMYQVVCTKSGPLGFFGSPEQGGRELTFTRGTFGNCATRNVRPEFGRVASKFLDN